MGASSVLLQHEDILPLPTPSSFFAHFLGGTEILRQGKNHIVGLDVATDASRQPTEYDTVTCRPAQLWNLPRASVGLKLRAQGDGTECGTVRGVDAKLHRVQHDMRR